MKFLIEFIKLLGVLIILRESKKHFPKKIKKIEEIIINLGIMFFLAMHFTNNKIVWETGEIFMSVTILILIRPLVEKTLEVIEKCYLKLKSYITK